MVDTGLSHALEGREGETETGTHLSIQVITEQLQHILCNHILNPLPTSDAYTYNVCLYHKRLLVLCRF